MRRASLLVSSFLFLGLILLSTDGYAERLSKKTLKRWVDPVVMEGKIAGEVTGKPLSNIRLYAYTDTGFEPIRFQIDEMTEDGDWIFPDGPFPNKDLSNGKFDAWDRLIFMADDTGDRVSKDAWLSGCTGSEIEVTDPLTGEKGWCYVLSFATNPPPQSSLPSYIRFDYATETFDTDTYQCKYIITEEGYHTSFVRERWIKKAAGGNEKEFIDRFKVRTNIKLLFGSLKICVHEETLKSNTLAYSVGPIRMNRRIEQFIRLPGGGKALRAVTDSIDYRNVAVTPVMIEIPFKFDTIVTSAVLKFGTDHNKNAYGGRVYNSCNPKGFLVNGKMDDGEENFNPESDKWRLITGDFGTSLARTIFPKNFMDSGVKITMGLIDDETIKLPPESDPGTVGYIWQDWDVTRLEKGKYNLFLQFANIPHYKPGDEIMYVNWTDNPLKIRSNDHEGGNQTLLLPVLSERYKKLKKTKD